MSLVTFIGPRPNLLGIDETEPADAARGAAADPHRRGHGEDPPHRAVHRRRVQVRTSSTSAIRRRGARTAWRRRWRQLCARGRGRDPARLQHPDRLRPQGVGATLLPIPALLATAAVHQHLVRKGLRTQHRPRRRDRLGARGPPLRAARGLRRRGDPSVPRARDARAAARAACRRSSPRGVGQALHQGDRQGAAQGDVQDGHLDLPVLLRRADLRGGRPAAARSSTSTSPAPRATSRASACSRSPRKRCGCTALAFGDEPLLARRARRRRRVRSTASAAKSTCGRRTRSPSCSTRRAPDSYATYKEYARAHQRPDASGC